MDTEVLYQLFAGWDLKKQVPESMDMMSGFFDELFENQQNGHGLETYLYKNDDVQSSIMREPSPKNKAIRQEEEFFKMFSSNIYDKSCLNLQKLCFVLIQAYGKKKVKPFLEQIAEQLEEQNEDQVEKILTDGLGELLGDGVPLFLSRTLTALEETIVKRYVKVKTVPRLTTVSMESVNDYRIALVLNGTVPAKKRECKYQWKAYGKGEYARMTDYIGIAEGALYHTLDQIFQKRNELMTEEERLEDVIYQSLKRKLDKAIEECCDTEGILKIDSEIYDYGLVHFIEYLDSVGIRYECIGPEKEKEVNLFGTSRLAFFAPFCLKMKKVYYSYADPKREAPDSLFRSYLYQVYAELFLLLYKEWRAEEGEQRLRRDEKIDAARVFEEKRNIPEKYRKEMENSKFRKVFGYVEIDDQCDLDKFHEIEREYSALQSLCFGKDENFQQVSIRFRKLGRHRASGLYFFTLRCLCVDIRYVYSFGHEYLHMIDYERGELSRKYEFLEIRNRYEETLRDAARKLEANDQMKVRLQGNSKYNMSYYLTPTEIFARCGELFFTEICGVQNSLLKPQYGIEYPMNDKVLMGMIDDYYSKIFPECIRKGDKVV